MDAFNLKLCVPQHLSKMRNIITLPHYDVAKINSLMFAEKSDTDESTIEKSMYWTLLLEKSNNSVFRTGSEECALHKNLAAFKTVLDNFVKGIV